jgi:hypothetical protein
MGFNERGDAGITKHTTPVSRFFVRRSSIRFTSWPSSDGMEPRQEEGNTGFKERSNTGIANMHTCQLVVLEDKTLQV